MTIRISVAMGTFNGARFLREQLDSIAEQSLAPAELVIGDDCSTDETLAIAEDFAARAPFPVRIHRNERNRGFADNFLATAERCGGEWIAFCDQDDAWYPHKLERIAERIAAYGPELMFVAHQLDLADGELRLQGRRIPPLARTRLSPPLGMPASWSHGGCAMVFRAELVRDFDWRKRPLDRFDWSSVGRPQQRQLPHDRWVCLLANALGSSLLLAESLGAFRRHGSATTGTHVVPLSDRLRSAAATGAEAYRTGEQAALDAAAALRGLAEAGTGREELLRAAVAFDRLAAVQAGRARLYEDRGLGRRLAELAALVRGKAYFGDSFVSSGVRSLLKDSVAVLAPSLLR
jgi:glycosyltransferase involved in cell wall biosynthesis